MINTLDFNEDIVCDNAESMIESLTWSNISYNVENGNYSLEDAKKLFPSHSELIDMIYKRDYKENYQ